MMQLIKYEFHKLFYKKIIFFLLILLLGLNLFLFLQEQKNVVFHNTAEYRTLLTKYSAMEPGQALNELNRLQGDYGILFRILYNRSTGVDETVVQNDVQLLLDNYPEPITYETFLQKYSYFLQNEDEFQAVNLAVSQLIGQLNALQSYPEFIRSMKDKAQEMEEVSVFAKKDTFSYRNIQKTVLDFSDLKNLPLALGQEEGLLAVSDFAFTDYFLMAFILLLAIFLFAEERENGLLPILKSTTHGRLKLAGSKLVVLLFSACCLPALFYGSNLVVATYRFGFGDTGRFLQSMSGFRDTEMPLTVLQYLILLFLLKLLALFLFAAVTALVFTVISNTRLTFLIIGGILAGSYLAYSFIYPTSYLNTIKYLNIFSFLDSYQMLAYYNNLNIFGYPVSRLSCSLFLLLLLIILCSLAYLLFFSKTGSKSSSSVPVLLKRKDLSRLTKGSVDLWNHELFKIMFSNKGLFLLLSALLLGLTNLDLSELFYTSDQYSYEYYAGQLAGTLNESKPSFLEEEQQRFDHLSKDIKALSEQYNKKEITRADYEGSSMKLSDFAKLYPGFQKAKQQYESLAALQEHQNLPLHFISSISSGYIFEDSGRDLLLGLLYSVLLILCLSNLFCSEYKNGMILLIRSTRDGRGKLFFKKAFLAYGTALILLLLLYAPVYITLVVRYDFTDWAAPVQSILNFGGIPFSISILQFILLVSVIQCITAFAMVSSLLLFAQLLQKQTLTILTGALALSVPMVFRYIVPGLFRGYTFADGFDMYRHFSEGNALSYVCLYGATMVILTVLAVTAAYRKFCNVH